ncbi:EF-hand domain-containing protein [Actinomadura kijaniata]|uniref:EF-hand domain-containing protein n=1 Tax=Actinomadura kijaniata TaxID=46161 RepID=UPI000830C451|nr:EF-hand domain-containing protein [Actinomadura kijaniata]
MSDFQQDKLAHRFRQLDVDGDGWLRQDDLRTTAGRLCDRLVPAGRSDLRAEIHAAYDALWEALREAAPAAADGLSQEDYTAAIAADSGGFSEAVRRIGMAQFDALDVDGNGVVDPDELFRLGSAYGLARDETDALFARLDLDGDGTIDRTEWLEAIQDFYYGDDPESAGALLFGRAA